MSPWPGNKRRTCDNCGVTLPTGKRRNRVGDQLLCDGCTEGKPGVPGIPTHTLGALEAAVDDGLHCQACGTDIEESGGLVRQGALLVCVHGCRTGALRTQGSLPGLHLHFLPEDDDEAVEHLHMVHGVGRTAAQSGDPLNTELLHQVADDGGFTVHDHLGDAPSSGYMVSLAKDSEQVLALDTLSADDIAAYRRKYATALAQPENYLGAWVYEGQVYLDVSQHVVDKATAIDLAHQRNQLGIFDLGSMSTIDTSGSQTKSAARHVAHDSGDGERVFHCPFCGAGQVTGRSDGTVECGFCQTVFTVQVQPRYPAIPQTVNGVPVNDPSMPGDGTHDPSPEEFAPAGTGQPSDDFAPAGSAAQPIVPAVPEPKAAALYVTEKGYALSEDAYLAHLALAVADDRDVVLEQVRERRGA